MGMVSDALVTLNLPRHGDRARVSLVRVLYRGQKFHHHHGRVVICGAAGDAFRGAPMRTSSLSGPDCSIALV